MRVVRADSGNERVGGQDEWSRSSVTPRSQFDSLHRGHAHLSRRATASLIGSCSSASTSSGWGVKACQATARPAPRTRPAPRCRSDPRRTNRRPRMVTSSSVSSSPISSRASLIASCKALAGADDDRRPRCRSGQARCPSSSSDAGRRTKSARRRRSSRPRCEWPACQSPSRWTSPRRLRRPVRFPFESRTSKTSSCRSVVSASGQKRSRTPLRAPSEMSWTVSSFRPGWISRRMTPSSSTRYWPTQSRRGE